MKVVHLRRSVPPWQEYDTTECGIIDPDAVDWTPGGTIGRVTIETGSRALDLAGSRCLDCWHTLAHVRMGAKPRWFTGLEDEAKWRALADLVETYADEFEARQWVHRKMSDIQK